MRNKGNNKNESVDAGIVSEIFRQKLLFKYKETMQLSIETRTSVFILKKELYGSNCIVSFDPGIRLLLVFELLFIKDIDTKVINRLQELTSLNAVSQTIIFTFHNWGGDIRENIKHHPSLHVVRQYPEDVLINKANMFPDFYYTDTLQNEDLFRVNAWVDVFMKRLKKIFHLVLSEYAAPKYDESYGKGNFATQCIKDFEEDIVAQVVKLVPSRQLTMDIGCGTGRHSFLLLNEAGFDKVIGFDFSPKMVQVAQGKKNEIAGSNVFDPEKITFERMDVEDEEFKQENGCADLICATFGMGSFVENINNLLKKFWLLLKDKGILVISFYNKAGIQYQVNPVWRDSSLSAKLTGNDELEVNIGGAVFTIYCKSYEFQEICRKLDSYFSIVGQYSFPTLSAFLPNSIFAENRFAQKIFKEIDMTIASKEDMMHGSYFLFICRKESSETFDIYNQIQDIFKEHSFVEGADYEFIRHEAVVDVDTLEKILNIPRNQVAKSILIENKNVSKRTKDSKTALALFAIEGNKKLDMKKAAKILGVQRRSIKLASQKMLTQESQLPLYGFFASFMKENKSMPVYFDEGLKDYEYLYTHFGDSRRTLKIRADRLFDITKPQFVDCV